MCICTWRRSIRVGPVCWWAHTEIHWYSHALCLLDMCPRIPSHWMIIHLYLYIYTYMYINLYVFLFIYILEVYIHIHIYICPRMHVHLNVYIYIYISEYLSYWGSYSEMHKKRRYSYRSLRPSDKRASLYRNLLYLFHLIYVDT
jgi:hypothetical protein